MTSPPIAENMSQSVLPKYGPDTSKSNNSESVDGVRALYLQQKGHVPEYNDYAAWQRTAEVANPVKSKRRPNSPETEILQIQINARRKTIQNYHVMRTKLVTANLELMTTIQKDECDVHTEVTKLLSQYEKFRGAIGDIKQRSQDELQEAREELERTKAETAAEITELEDILHRLDHTVQEKGNECELLIKFKGTDREYHLRLARMNELKTLIDNVLQEQIIDSHELASLVEKHHTNFTLNTDKKCKKIQESLTASALNSIPNSIRDVAFQNQIMKREITTHKKSVKEMEREIKEIEDEIRKEVKKNKEPKMNLTKKVDVCTPDTKLTLDIPRSTILEI